MTSSTELLWIEDPHAQTVTFIYETALGRKPDATGLQFWADELKQGLAPVDLLHSFVQTPEYTAQHAAQPTSALVEKLYQNALGRAPTQAELAHIKQQFETGAMTPASLIVSLVQSQEAYTHLFADAQDRAS